MAFARHPTRSFVSLGCALIGAALLPLGLVGCPEAEPEGLSIFNNSTDPTNDGANYIGSAACTACHADYAATHQIHGHAQQLKAGVGAPPSYPAEGTSAGVPAPPAGQPWSNIAYVIGGYRKAALFIDQNGFIQTNGSLAADAQWNLGFPPNGTATGFGSYMPAAGATPYAFDCFRCHTTGAVPQDPANPQFQDGRAGILGTWNEAGAQCESCHGPGSKHAPNPTARNIYVNSSSARCGQCHGDADANIIPAADGYVVAYAQYPELLASGGHAGFQCTFCHDPHVSTTYDRPRGIRNECTVCHTEDNMALHDGAVFVRGDYSEVLTCESCHMPYAGRYFSSASADVVGTMGRMGDTRSHIFRINSGAAGFANMFSGDGSRVVKDAEGRAAVTVDFVCLRCHNGQGNVFNLTISRAAEIAPNLHKVFE